MAPFQDADVTDEPLSCPFQTLMMDVPPGIVRLTLHREIAVSGAETFTDPMKPPFQAFTTLKVARQPPPKVWVTVGVAVTGGGGTGGGGTGGGGGPGAPVGVTPARGRRRPGFGVFLLSASFGGAPP